MKKVRILRSDNAPDKSPQEIIPLLISGQKYNIKILDACGRGEHEYIWHNGVDINEFLNLKFSMASEWRKIRWKIIKELLTKHLDVQNWSCGRSQLDEARWEYGITVESDLQ